MIRELMFLCILWGCILFIAVVIYSFESFITVVINFFETDEIPPRSRISDEQRNSGDILFEPTVTAPFSEGLDDTPFRNARQAISSGCTVEHDARTDTIRIIPPVTAHIEAYRQHQRTIESERREKAELVARELLIEHLSPRERKQFEALGHFDVLGNDSTRTYRISRGSPKCLDTHTSYCIHTTGNVPSYDNMLALKLAFENEENNTLRTANRIGGDYHDGPRAREPRRMRPVHLCDTGAVMGYYVYDDDEH